MDLVDRLARTRIGSTHNQYARSPLRRERLRAYLEQHATAPVILVGEAAGYRGARISGVPFTSERQLTGTGTAEASATIVHRVLGELDAERRVILWNTVPHHPHHPERPLSNRRPTQGEVEAGAAFAERLLELVQPRQLVAVGRIAESVLGERAVYVRHPANGGGAAFAAGMAQLLTDGER